jgi:hypothetical protein
LKKCTACATELPDVAAHCGVCGKRQPLMGAAVPAAKPPNNRTQMGYSADDLLKQLAAQGHPLPAQRQPTSPPAIAAAAPPAHLAKTIGPDSNIAAALGAAVNAPSASQVPFLATLVPESARSATVVAQPTHTPAQAYPQIPQLAPTEIPLGARDPRHMATLVEPMGGAPIRSEQAHVASGGLVPQPPIAGPFVPPAQRADSKGEPTGSVPLSPDRFQAAVFQPQGAAMAQSDAPAAHRLSLNVAAELRNSYSKVCLVFGILSLIAFAVPRSTDPLLFSWDGMGDLPLTALLMGLLPAIVGLIAIVLAILPISTVTRGAIGLVVCMAAILGPVVMSDHVELRDLLIFAAVYVGPVVVVGGLIYRDVFRASLRGRIATVAGGLIAITPLFVPQNGQMMISRVFDAFGSDVAATKMSAFFMLIPPVLIAAAMGAVWIKSPSGAGAKAIAWLLILWPVATALTTLIVAGHIAAVVKNNPSQALLAWVPLASLAAVAGYAFAAILTLGKSES